MRIVILAVSIQENIRHLLSEELRLLPVEMYIIFVLKFFRKISLSSPLTYIALFTIDRSILPTLLFKLVWEN